MRRLDLSTDSNSNQIGDFVTETCSAAEEEEDELVGVDESQQQQDKLSRRFCKPADGDAEYHWCEEDDLSEATCSGGSGSDCRAGRDDSAATVTADLTESSLTASDPNYVELAKKIDTNLAHIDMEDFKSEDIHSLLVDYSEVSALRCDMQDSLRTPSSQVRFPNPPTKPPQSDC